MKFGIAGFRPGHEERIAIAKKIGYDFMESCLFALNDDYTEESIKELAAFFERNRYALHCGKRNVSEAHEYSRRKCRPR